MKQSLFISFSNQYIWLVVVLTSLIGFLLPERVYAQPNRQPDALPLNQIVQRELIGGSIHRYSIDLKKGETLVLNVEQIGIDVVLTLLSPQREKILEKDGSSQGGEILFWSSPKNGTYIVEVKSLSSTARSGPYNIQATLTSNLAGKDKSTQAQILMAEAISLVEKNTAESKRAAVAKFESARELYQEVGNKSQAALCAAALGKLYDDAGEKRKALTYYDQALQIFTSTGDEDRIAMMLNNIGGDYSDLGENQKAIDYFNKALVIHRKLTNKGGLASTLIRLGSTYQELGDTQKAGILFSEALELYISVGDKSGEARGNGHFASLFNDIGDKAKAIEYYRKSLSLSRANSDKSWEAKTLSALGIVYEQLGDPEKALENFNPALSLARSIGDKVTEATCLHNIGRAYQDLGDHQRAITNFNQALILRRSSGNKNGEAATLVSLGYSYGLLQEPKAAVDFLDQALLLFREVGNKGSEAATLNNAAIVLLTLGNIKKAFTYYLEALALARFTNNKRVEAETLYGLALIFISSDNIRAGTFLGKMAVDRLQGLRANVNRIDKNLQQTYLKSFEDTYRGMAAFLMAQGRFAEALQIINLFKDQEYFDFADNRQVTPMALTVRETEFAAELNRTTELLASVTQEISSLKSNEGVNSLSSKELSESLQAKFNKANEEYKFFFQKLEQQFKGSPDEKDKEPIVQDLQNIQTALRETSASTGQKTVAVYTVIFDNNFLALIVTGNSIDWAASVLKEDLNMKSRQLLYLLRRIEYDPRPTSKEIYDLIFVPIEGKLPNNTQTILWSLDGTLRYLPMSALYDGNKYLVERYNNVVITRSDKERILRNTSAIKSGIGFGVSEAHTFDFRGAMLSLEALPSVKTELRKIFTGKGVPGVLAGEVLLDGQFTKRSMLSALKKPPPLVHIASHFRFVPGDESKSFLLLGDGTPLTLDDLKEQKGLFKGVDLLTLSACQTAAQRPNATGREIDGFAELAQRLGAGAVLASLWEVSDESTAELMTLFYQNYTKGGANKATAIRAAQLALLKGEYSRTTIKNRQLPQSDVGQNNINIDPAALVLFKAPTGNPFAHPFYWSPFILIGNWK
jgi:CHAT domain-containing protein/tetratricopeptide (TPR) repeat protein